MPLLFFLLEIFIFVTMINQIGFIDSLLVYLVPTIIGILIFRNQNKTLILNIQNTQNPPQTLIKQGLTFIAAILLIFPSFISKLLGLFILLPFVRTLLAWGFQGFLLKKVFAKNNSFTQFGTNGFKFYYQKFESGPFPSSDWQSPQANSQTVSHTMDKDIIEAKFKKIEETNSDFLVESSTNKKE
ncbi:MAG: FxsA family protein [Deltaproteobacteria bacterium]|jgi:UPF0716 protein FxsA|nr:FxsA family protein [Deltaproteobacteria bacterium]